MSKVIELILSIFRVIKKSLQSPVPVLLAYPCLQNPPYDSFRAKFRENSQGTLKIPTNLPYGTNSRAHAAMRLFHE